MIKKEKLAENTNFHVICCRYCGYAVFAVSGLFNKQRKIVYVMKLKKAGKQDKEGLEFDTRKNNITIDRSITSYYNRMVLLWYRIRFTGGEMKKVAVLCFLLVIILSPVASARPVGVGVFAGPLYPITQDDQETGFGYGVKVRIEFAGPVVMEPNLSFGGFGDVEIAGIGKRDGTSVKYYGIDLVLGNGLASMGPKPYLFLGGGVYNLKRDGDETVNKSGWSVGGGLAWGILPFLDVDLRGRVNIVSFEGSTSKKSVGATVGATYYFGS